MNKKKLSKKVKQAKTKQAKVGKSQVKQTRSPWADFNYIYTLILLAYGFITVLTPNMMTLDSLGPKFLSLSILNLISYIILLSGKEFRSGTDQQMHLFRTPVGIAYTLFLVVALLSFFKAININESIINFSKLFTLFSAAYIVSIIIQNDSRHLRILAITLSLLLIVDSFTVFFHVATSTLAGKGPNIVEIKSVYSNKNILAAAIFVKIPFALWLLSFDKLRVRLLGLLTVFFALLATLLLSTRSFYLGFIFMTITYVAFMGIRYHRKNERRQLIKLLISVGVTIALAMVLFSGVLKFLYPKPEQDKPGFDMNKLYTVDFLTRLKTITQGEGGRTLAWTNSLKLIKEHPLLGVGTGNWKVEELKYENLTSTNYIYLYKSHNDFIETTAETGIVGGLLFLSIFLLIGYNFLRAFFRRGATEKSYMYLFLPAFGIFAYSFDAFFNFPADRPEICSLFAIYVGAGIAFSKVGSWSRVLGSSLQSAKTDSNPEPETRNLKPETWNLKPETWNLKPETWNLKPIIISIFLLLQTLSIYFLYMNFESLKLQRLIKDEQIRGPLELPSGMFITGFPWIPDINVQGEPIAVQKARYLFNEGKFQETIDLLKQDHSSPYDTRPEVFIAVCYSKLGQLDSALVYYDKVYKQKPNFYGNIANMVITLENMGRYEEAAKYLEPYTNDPAILKQQRDLITKAQIRKYDTLFKEATNQYQNQNFGEAVRLFSKIISIDPLFIEAYDYRAFCYYSLKEYQKSINDIEKVFASGVQKPNLMNMRGVNYQMLGNVEAACRNFKAAMKMGDKDAERNYKLLCEGIK